MFHQFLREVLEELYDQRELIEDSGYIDPQWFYDVAPIPELLEMRESNRMQFEIIGWGFDAYSCEVHLASFAKIDDEEFVEREFARMRRNWEIQGITPTPIEHLGSVISADMTYVTTAFTLSCLAKRFQTGM